MGVVCFAVRNCSNDEMAGLVERINATGQTYLTLTRLRGRAAIRLGLGNLRTTDDDLRAVWNLVCEIAFPGKTEHR
jgi:aromatic-L-amino-acid decarboxylase